MTPATLPLHVVDATGDPLLGALLAAGVAVSSALVVGGVLAWRRRRSTPYLLVALALATLAVKGVVGATVLVGLFPTAAHHTVEHGLDLLMAVLLVGAVALARGRPGGDVA